MILSTLVTSQLDFEMCAGLYGHPVVYYKYTQFVVVYYKYTQMHTHEHVITNKQ